MDIRPEALYTDTKMVELTATIKGDQHSDTRDRMVAHAVADLTNDILRRPGISPRGLIVSVAAADPSDARSDLVVVATAAMQAA